MSGGTVYSFLLGFSSLTYVYSYQKGLEGGWIPQVCSKYVL
jgi:hypothetical protein